VPRCHRDGPLRPLRFWFVSLINISKLHTPLFSELILQFTKLFSKLILQFNFVTYSNENEDPGSSAYLKLSPSYKHANEYTSK
jgi:hypothetical protein